MKEKKEVTRND